MLVSLLLLAVLLGLVPDRKSAVRKGRAALAEAIAIHRASAAGGRILEDRGNMGRMR